MPVIYKFGEFRLDCERFELLRNDRPVKLERKPMDLLVLFTRRQGELVTRAEIAEQLWAEDVFVDTEHGINTAVRKLRMLLRDDADDPRYIETVPGRGYCFVARVTVETPSLPPSPEPARGELPQAAVQGADQGTTKGAVQRTVQGGVEAAIEAAGAPSVESRARTHAGFRVGWLAAAAVVGLAIAGAVGFLVIRRHSAPQPSAVTSLAVLPLENLSGDAGQEYFADGMTDELTTMLARNSTLGIRSRTSVMQYKRAHQPLPQIARVLGVDAVVEGSVVRKDGRVHLNLQLIRAADDSHLWAQSYDQDAGDTLLPEEAAQEIARQLHAVRPNVPAAHKIDPAAHDAYLRGMYLWFSSDMEKSGFWFRKATELQPDYAAAWAGLANYYGEGVAGGGPLDPRTSLGPEEEAARRSLQLDPNLAEAHAAMAAAYLIVKWDGTNADREIQHAIHLDPGLAELYYFRACVQQYFRQDEAAIASARRSEELAPAQRPSAVASILVGAKKYDAALNDLRLRLQGSPHDSDLLFQTADAFRRKGDYPQYAEFTEKWLLAEGDANSAASLRRAWQQGGMPAFVREQIRDTNQWAKTHYVSPVYLAKFHAMIGEKDQALDLLEEGYRQHSTEVLWIVDDPAFDSLHNEPRFRTLIQSTGRPPAE